MQTSLTHSSRSSVDPQDLQATAEITLMGFSSSNQYKKIREFLERTPNIAIHKIHDIRLYTLLHLACLNGQTELCRFYFEYLERQGLTREQIEEWVNAGTDEGFTALHFASFKGSIHLIRMLVEERRADLHLKNHKGSNVVHLAAQGDQPISLAYFRSRGMDIYKKDTNGSTALHWATYFGMENATYFLTSWGCNPNEKDNEFGCTPLHLAISSGNSKVVRRLLIKGADKRIRNNEGKLPLDLAIENDYPSIVELLQEKNWLMRYLNVTPDITKKRTRSSLFLFQFMLVALILSNILIIFPYISNVFWVIGWAVLVPITVISFFFAWLRDPGYIQSRNPEILDLLIKHPPHVICSDCSIVKPDRSKHCELCNKCVALYDHHCPWINNCVGARNYGWFIFFILSILFTMVFLMLFTGFHVLEDEVKETYMKKLFNVNDQYMLKLIVCIVNVLLGLIFLIPLIGLNYVQMGNLVRGKTTGERFGFQGGRDAISKSSNLLSSQSIDPDGQPRSVVRRETNGGNQEKKKKWYTNCIDMCCRNSKNNKYQLVQQEER